MAKFSFQFPQYAAIALASLLAVPSYANEETEWEEHDASQTNQQITQSIAYEAGNAQAQQNAPFRRRVMREDISVRTKTLRLDSGKKVQLVHGMPKKAKNCPAVFILDVETNVMANAIGLRLPHLSKRQRKEVQAASYLLRSPFGSNMIGNGFGVAYIVADDLDTIRSARTNDWVGIIDRVRDLKQVDDNSVFLFSTREYANLSVYLASKYNFSGFILEEPSYMLFSRSTFENVIDKADRLTEDEIWQRTDPTRAFRYREILGKINTPIMLIRNPDSNAYAFNQKTLIPALDSVHAYYETVEIDGYGRSLTVFGGNDRTGVIDIAPEVTYHPATVSKWVDEMLVYMRMNSSAEAVALRDPSNYRNW